MYEWLAWESLECGIVQRRASSTSTTLTHSTHTQPTQNTRTHCMRNTAQCSFLFLKPPTLFFMLSFRFFLLSSFFLCSSLSCRVFSVLLSHVNWILLSCCVPPPPPRCRPRFDRLHGVLLLFLNVWCRPRNSDSNNKKQQTRDSAGPICHNKSITSDSLRYRLVKIRGD